MPNNNSATKTIECIEEVVAWPDYKNPHLRPLRYRERLHYPPHRWVTTTPLRYQVRVKFTGIKETALLSDEIQSYFLCDGATYLPDYLFCAAPRYWLLHDWLFACHHIAGIPLKDQHAANSMLPMGIRQTVNFAQWLGVCSKCYDDSYKQFMEGELILDRSLF